MLAFEGRRARSPADEAGWRSVRGEENVIIRIYSFIQFYSLVFLLSSTPKTLSIQIHKYSWKKNQRSLPEGKQPGQMRAARGRRLHPEDNLSNEKMQMFDIRLFHDKNVRFQLQ